MRNSLVAMVCLLGLAVLAGCSGSGSVPSGGGTDPTSPVISSVSLSGMATSTTTVNWATNVDANSRVDYGTTTAYGSNVSDSTLVTSHSLTLNSLTCGTTYHYEITSVGSAGSASTADATFTTSACATISGVSVSPTATTAVVSWTTSVSANSRVDYGTTTAYGSNVSDSTLVTSHSLTLNSLTCGTTYHYQITSTVAPGNSASTGDATFATSACATISGVSVSPTATTAVVSWTTSSSANSRVDYGTTTAYGSNVSDSTLVTSHSLTLNSLTCGTTYHYKITSVGSAGSASTADATFTTSACGITISGVSVSPTATTAVVSWTTSSSANSRVDYGTTTAYGSNVSDSTLVTSHSLTLNSLTCNTTYHYEITSVGSAGSASTADATFTTSACGGPVSDDFHSSVLNPMWTFHATCCGFLRMNGTDALLVVPSVTPHFSVGLLQNIADVDFQVETKFDSLVTQGDQLEGILVQQDSQNFIWFGVYHDGTTPRLYAVVELGGTPSLVYNNIITIAPGSTSFWMRVKRAGTAWTQSWSTDGTTYNSAILTQSLTVSAIGPAAGNDHDSNNDPTPSFTAAVDYFFNTASPISPTDGGLPKPPNQPVFNVWYGDNQTFGQHGVAQQWVNILGNVSAPSGIASASYTLNGGQSQFLRVGPNGTRLVDTGDFNVEIDHTILNPTPATNTVVITATDNLNHTTTHTVTVNWDYTGQVWPLPYSIDWSTVTNISDVAQVVDGGWALQPDGTVRSTQAGYDRLIAFGDVTWTDYSVTAELTFNSVDCVDFGAGIVVGWTGHTYGDPLALSPDQPRTGHPFFGQAGYGTPGTLKIYANSPNYPETTLAQDTSGLKLALGVKYMMKFAVQRTSSTTSEYYLKVWPSSATEPSSWNLQAQGDASTGAALIGTGAADVSFGKITVAAFP